MKCPLCSNEMETLSSTTFSKNLKEYSRKNYHCKLDDVWIVIEIPKEKFKKVY
jgi:hypothetical protein